MATTTTAAETIDHLDVIWHDSVDALEETFRAALGHEIAYTRLGDVDVQRFDNDGNLHHLHHLITERGQLTRVEKSPTGFSLRLTIGGVPTSVHSRHPVADATRFALTIYGAADQGDA